MNNIVKKGIYKHFKGNFYIVEDIATHCDDGSLYVIYRALYEDNKLYIRSIDNFLSEVDKAKGPYFFKIWGSTEYESCKYDIRRYEASSM